MVGTILIAVLVLATGMRASDAVRLRQQELILTKLPTPEAAAYYRVLRRRAWTIRALRAVALLSLLVIIYARNRVWQAGRAAPPTGALDVGAESYLAQRR